MNKRIIALLIATSMVISLFTGCGKKEEPVDLKPLPREDAAESEAEVASESSTDADWDQINALGDVNVDKDLFDVKLTIPKDFIGETTQEKLDAAVKEKGYKSATLNDDGSVTYVITKAQHKEMLDEIKKTIDKGLEDMVKSSDYPSITNVTANNDYTVFTVTTKNEEPDLAESMSVLALYMYGGMYAIFSGESTDNIHVDFVNDATGKVIKSADSKNMGESGDE